MLYIRADGNAELGTGHIMRCLSIAKAHRRSGCDCTFITADTQMKPLLNEQRFPVICLDSAWNDLGKETEKMEQLITGRKIKKLLLDSYFVTHAYLERLHKLTYLVYMDDLDAFVYPCSELINYNIYADKLDYPSRYPNTKLLLGPQYAPLREEFRGLPPRRIRKRAESVFVTTGGSDPFNVAGELIKRAKQNPKLTRLHFHIVAGRFNAHLPELRALAEEFSGVTVHQSIENMARLMLDCDIAVSAGGSTLYELCACGVPTVVFSMADNQLAGVSAFDEGYMLGCGDYRENKTVSLDKLIDNVTRLARDSFLRRELSQKCQNLMNKIDAKNICEQTLTESKVWIDTFEEMREN